MMLRTTLTKSLLLLGLATPATVHAQTSAGGTGTVTIGDILSINLPATLIDFGTIGGNVTGTTVTRTSPTFQVQHSGIITHYIMATPDGIPESGSTNHYFTSGSGTNNNRFGSHNVTVRGGPFGDSYGYLRSTGTSLDWYYASTGETTNFTFTLELPTTTPKDTYTLAINFSLIPYN